jgi:hypothetical protein
MHRKFEGLRRQSRLTKVLLFPAWCLTGVARAMVLFFPFKIFSRYLGIFGGVAAFVPLTNAGMQQTALSIGRAVRMASTLTPWNANCQAQAIAARILLGIWDVPYILCYGVAKEPGQTMRAHAWVCCGQVRVTGGYSFDEFTVVSTYHNLKVQTS